MVTKRVLDVVYDIQFSAGGPEKWVYMDSLKEYFGEPRRAWAVPGDRQSMVTHNDTTPVLGGQEDVPPLREGGRTWATPNSGTRVPSLLFSPTRDRLWWSSHQGKLSQDQAETSHTEHTLRHSNHEGSETHYREPWCGKKLVDCQLKCGGSRAS